MLKPTTDSGRLAVESLFPPARPLPVRYEHMKPLAKAANFEY